MTNNDFIRLTINAGKDVWHTFIAKNQNKMLDMFRDIIYTSAYKYIYAEGMFEREFLKEFGIPMKYYMYESIVSALVNSSKIETQYNRSGFKRLVFTCIRTDFEDALAADGASYISKSNKRGTETKIDWLAWQIFGNVAIANFGMFSPAKPAGRQGAIMVPIGGKLNNAYIRGPQNPENSWIAKSADLVSNSLYKYLVSLNV